MDSIANMLIMMKNGSLAGKESVSFPYSKLKNAIGECLKKEGYVGQVSKKVKMKCRLTTTKQKDDIIFTSDNIEDILKPHFENKIKILMKNIYTSKEVFKVNENKYTLKELLRLPEILTIYKSNDPFFDLRDLYLFILDCNSSSLVKGLKDFFILLFCYNLIMLIILITYIRSKQRTNKLIKRKINYYIDEANQLLDKASKQFITDVDPILKIEFEDINYKDDITDHLTLVILLKKII
jgi:ribosomal protein S8